MSSQIACIQRFLEQFYQLTIMVMVGIIVIIKVRTMSNDDELQFERGNDRL
jgi:hypothetical protein